MTPRLLPSLLLAGTCLLLASQHGVRADSSVEDKIAASLEHLTTLQPAQPRIPDRRFTLTDFGAVGDGKTLNTDAFRKAIAAVHSAGGGHLIIPAGHFKTGGFELCSKLDLHLEEGAFIEAPSSFAEYGLPDPSTIKLQAEADLKVGKPRPFITGEGLQDLAITGKGEINGNGALWWAWSERAERRQKGRIVYKRNHLILLNNCDRVLISDLTLRNSPMFHLVPKNITDLTIDGVKVRAPFDAPNTDAIDPGPVTRCVVRNCDIDTGDDDIVIKAGADQMLIEHCTIKHGHGLSVGSETNVGVHDVLVRDCTLEGTDNGIRIKSMVGKGGPVSNIRYTNIRMKDVENAFLFDLNYVDNNYPNYKGDPAKTPSIHGILIDHVTVEGSPKAGRIVGLPQSPITGLFFRDVSIEAEKDFVIKDANPPVMTNVTKRIEPGVAKDHQKIVE